MSSPNLAIAHIAQNQTQKEVTANGAFDNLDQALTQRLAINCAGNANITPATAAALYAMFIDLSGALTGNISILLPANKKPYIVNNGTTGAFTVTIITTAGGSTGVTLFPGDVRLLYSDGTNVKQAHAPLGGNPNSVVTVTAAYTVPAVPGHQTIICDATAGVFTVTLPDATLVKGSRITVLKKDASANAVTVAAFGAQTINGVATQVLAAQYAKQTSQSDGAQNYIV